MLVAVLALAGTALGSWGQSRRTRWRRDADFGQGLAAFAADWTSVTRGEVFLLRAMTPQELREMQPLR